MNRFFSFRADTESRGYGDRKRTFDASRECAAHGSLVPALIFAPACLAQLSVEEGAWLLKGLVVVAFVLGILVALKKLREPAARVPLEVRSSVSFVEEPVFKEFTDYVHQRNHDFAKQMQHLELAAEERRVEAAEQSSALIRELQALGEKLDNKRSASVGNLHEQLKGAELKLERVSKEAEVHTQQLVAVDQKLTNILQRLPRSARL